MLKDNYINVHKLIFSKNEAKWSLATLITEADPTPADSPLYVSFHPPPGLPGGIQLYGTFATKWCRSFLEC